MSQQVPETNEAANKRTEAAHEYIKRMVDEYAQLTARVNKLEAFLCTDTFKKNVPFEEQARMIQQLGFMSAYHQVLKVRLERAPKPATRFD